MIVVGNTLRFAQKAGLDHRHVWQSAGGTIGEELRGRRADRKVLRTPQRQERDIAEIVTAADAVVGQPVPNRGQLRYRGGVAKAIGLCGVLVDAVGKGFGHNRGEIPAACRPSRSGLPQESQI